MQTLELLSPAKDLSCGIAAIEHGADAVYIGARRFGARAAAGNSVEDIAELCRFAHQFGAKVYVTVNTIVYDHELDESVALVHELERIGADAILVQDMGLVKKLREGDIPKSRSCKITRIPLHASTQTDNRTAEKVRWLASLGFRRIVLARELSIDEIAAIHRAVPDVELEVFVHGALCVSYSGQCYASEYCFNRSANRGECAQFCRLAFTLKDADGHIIERDRHLLSLKDMCQFNNLERLAEAGAVSFKIEGRLKDVDYVKNVTAAYSERLNEIVAKHPDRYRRVSHGRVTLQFHPDVRKSFNRGFTTYFADGRKINESKQPETLVSFDTPKAMGEYVGKVKEIRGHSFNVAGTASFANGDGLCFLDADHQLVGFRVNRVEGNRIFPLRMPEELKPGTRIFRNYDKVFAEILNKESSKRTLSVDFKLTTTNSKVKLEASDELGRTAVSTADCELFVAEKPQYENIIRQLSKLGGTQFHANEIKLETEAFIPSSVLSKLRREAIDALVATPQATQDKHSHNEPPRQQAPNYKHNYLYNASNKSAQEFYREQGIEDATAFEISKSRNLESTCCTILMQCRYCLRNELGYCTKTSRRAPWKEPLTLNLPDGRAFDIRFDCHKCQMNIYK